MNENNGHGFLCYDVGCRGHRIKKTQQTDGIIAALEDGIKKYGVPKQVYVDDGVDIHSLPASKSAERIRK